VVRVPDRVLQRLRAAGIEAAIHYPDPLHRIPALADVVSYPKGAFPVAERISGELLTLPLFAEITPAQQERVASALEDALAHQGTV
jgi:dTDP-4-amino-4,6-dideoxygalactose transaminase